MRLLYAQSQEKEANQMNIGGLYNASSMFQSMYNTNSYGSSSMASLTSSILGGSSSGMYSALSDRSLIQSGSYGKLLGAYYDRYGDEDVKKNSSNDILAKLKETYSKAEDKTVTETEDGKVIEKTEAADNKVEATKKDNETTTSPKKDTDVLSDLMRRNRTISYTNMGGVVKNMSAPSFDYIV